MIDEQSLIAPLSMMEYYSQPLKVYDADKTWQIRFLCGSA